MNYSELYDSIILSAKSRNINTREQFHDEIGYCELHHIKPASLCRYSKRHGELYDYIFDIDADHPENLILLTAEEHILAHVYLHYIYGGSMTRALYSMINQSNFDYESIDTIKEAYSQAREQHASRMSEIMRNRTVSAETRRKLSESRLGVEPHNKGKPMSEETKKKLSEINLNRTDEHRERLSESLKGKAAWNKGIPHSEETKQRIKESKQNIGQDTKRKMSDAKKNAPFIKCPHCNMQSQNAANMKRWHFDNCKHINRQPDE